MLQKIITIQDLTLCLDKMDTSGKIEIYQVFFFRFYFPSFPIKKYIFLRPAFIFRILYYTDVLWQSA